MPGAHCGLYPIVSSSMIHDLQNMDETRLKVGAMLMLAVLASLGFAQLAAETDGATGRQSNSALRNQAVLMVTLHL